MLAGHPVALTARHVRAALIGFTLVCAGALPAAAGIDEGYVAYVKGDFDAALAEWRPLARDGNAEAANDIAYVLAQQGVNLIEALDNAHLAVKAMPGTAAVLDTMGWVLFRLGRYAEALPYLEEAQAKAQRDPEVLEHLGDTYWKLGRRADAQVQWRTAYPVAQGDDAQRVLRKIAAGYEPPPLGQMRGVVLDIVPGRLFTRTPVQIKSWPRDDAEPLALMPPGTEVAIIGVVRGMEWLATENAGVFGYVPAALLERTP